jgi:hypothetical protein
MQSCLAFFFIVCRFLLKGVTRQSKGLNRRLPPLSARKIQFEGAQAQ